MGQISVAIALLVVLFAAPVRAETQLERGRYLVETLAGCGNCHTPRGPNGPLTDKKFAGGEIIKHEDFTAVVANITPDPETGIGRWTDREIITAIRDGRRPDGSLIGPAMPSRSYRHLADEDIEAIVAYLRSVPPVHNPITVKSHYDAPLPASWGPPVGRVEAPAKDDKVAYGGYLAGPLGLAVPLFNKAAASLATAVPSKNRGFSPKRSMLLVWENATPELPHLYASGKMPPSPVRF